MCAWALPGCQGPHKAPGRTCSGQQLSKCASSYAEIGPGRFADCGEASGSCVTFGPECTPVPLQPQWIAGFGSSTSIARTASVTASPGFCNGFSSQQCPAILPKHPASNLDDNQFESATSWVTYSPDVRSNTDKSKSVDVSYTFDAPVTVTKYKIQPRNTNRNLRHSPKAWVLKGSNDGKSWVDLDSKENQRWSSQDAKEFDLSTNAGAFKIIKLAIYQVQDIHDSGGFYIGLTEWGLYGQAR
mmetsp:Transcript_71720/g.126595  ORF Transcript_71720/g.126595 Transcript_71720/m.126595 type:complete len:243 (-) Transcript_71720:60-788(-)